MRALARAAPVMWRGSGGEGGVWCWWSGSRLSGVERASSHSTLARLRAHHGGGLVCVGATLLRLGGIA